MRGPVTHVGVDLAWGSNGVTGLAAVGPSGQLVDLAMARTDHEIAGWLRTWTDQDCVVAFDAPLIVTNRTGARECEKLVGRYFHQAGIACHPTNRGNPAFRDGGRGWRLANRLALDLDPFGAAARRAIEVYPHTAIVELFGLDRALRYKHKPGRSFQQLRSELVRLMELLEGLAGADPRLDVAGQPQWRRVRREVDGATRKSQLKAVEDGVDAVVCAYVAFLTTAAPHRVRVLGGSSSGSIVTPVSRDLAARIDAGAGHGRAGVARP